MLSQLTIILNIFSHLEIQNRIFEYEIFCNKFHLVFNINYNSMSGMKASDMCHKFYLLNN